MNRRNFIVGTLAALVVGPKAIADMLERARLECADYNQWPTGLMDAVTSSSVHDLHGNTWKQWNVDYGDVTNSRFTPDQVAQLFQQMRKQAADSTLAMAHYGLLN